MNFKSDINKINGYLLLKSGKVYDPFQSLYEKRDILIKDGVLTKIDNNITEKSNYKVLHCKNKIITTGFIDLHAHFREPGFEFKETIKSGSESAFHGGFTRICTMPNTNPTIDSPEMIENIIQKSKPLPIYIHPIGAITKNQKGLELSEIGQMVSSGAVAISDDGFPIENSQILRMALEYSKQFNIPVINHAEDLFLMNNGIVNEGECSLKLGLIGNPDISESTMVYRDLSIAEHVSGKLHIPHVSSRKSVEIIKNFKEKGLDVTAEVTPHHLCLTEDVLHSYNTNAKVAPPIRTLEDKNALIEGVKSGIINCIATDHAPHAIEDKESDIHHAPCGMIGLESAFGLVHKTLSQEKVSLTSIIDLFTKNPSKIIGITPNIIKEGEIAEINIIDPKCNWKFRIKDIKSKSINSPIIGMELLGKIVATINKGFISNCKSPK